MNESEATQETEELYALMVEGCQEMAEEDLKYAEEIFPLASETVFKYPKWDNETT